MKYINKQIASDTAFNMLKLTRDKIESKENELSDFCEKLVLNSITKKEMDLINQLDKDWIEYKQYFYFTCSHSTTRTQIKINKQLPKKICWIFN